MHPVIILVITFSFIMRVNKMKIKNPAEDLEHHILMTF